MRRHNKVGRAAFAMIDRVIAATGSILAMDRVFNQSISEMKREWGAAPLNLCDEMMGGRFVIGIDPALQDSGNSTAWTIPFSEDHPNSRSIS